MKLARASDDSKEVGWVTSVARSERLGKEIALGYVKRGFNTAGANLDAFASKDSRAVVSTPVELVPLPFR